LQAGGRRITNRTVYKVVGGNFVRFTARIKELRQMGLLVSVSDGDTNDTN
jgi:hypothetical protein